MLMLVWRDLRYRQWRVLAVTVLMGVVLTLLFLLTGLVGQFNTEPLLATQQSGGDQFWLVPEGTAGPFTSAQAAPEALLAEVEGATPILVGSASALGRQVLVVGRSTIGSDRPTLIDGRQPASPGEIVVDETLGAALGDEIAFNGAPATVVGIANDATVLAGIPLVFATLEESQVRLFAGEKVVIGALVPTLPDDIPPGLRAMTTDEVAADTLLPLAAAIDSVALTQALLWIIASIIIAAVIYITALERTRDFAVLKAVGGRDRDLGVSLLIQGVAMTLAATGIAAVAQRFFAPLFPLAVRIPSAAWWQIPVIGVAVAVVAALGGIWKVVNTSPAEAFS